jgi:hypothetical protein
VLCVRLAGLGLALLLVISGAGAAHAQAQRSQPVQAPASNPATTGQAEPQPDQPPQQAEPAPSLTDPRPGQQGPVSIRIIPNPKSEAELIAERQEREQRASLDTNLQIFGALLVAFAFFQFIALVVQGVYLWLALSALRRPFEHAERNLRLAQRAFVNVSSMTWKVVGANVRVTPTLENSGLTPTRNLRISTNWKVWHGELPPDFVHKYSRAPDRLFLGPRGRAEIGAALVPMRDIQAAIEQRLDVYFWGRATYEEIFEGAEPHYLEFCYRLDADGATSGDLSLSFTPFGLYNRTDEDRLRPAAADQGGPASR